MPDITDGLNEMPESMPIKTTRKQVVMVGDFITSDTQLNQSVVKNSIEEGENIVTQTIFVNRFICSHPFDGTNFGIVTHDEPTIPSRVVREHFRQYGEIIVCKNCIRVCSQCRKEITKLTGFLTDGKWFCNRCYPGYGIRCAASWLCSLFTPKRIGEER